jgi:long-subunit acyl-CoA synthetase (AMP-forming)
LFCFFLICLRYHTSETGIVTLTHRADVAPGSLGAPLPGCEVRLAPIMKLDLAGEYGEPGEIEVRLAGSDEWHKTGDSGLWGRHGALRFVDRIEWCQLADKRVYEFGKLSNLYSRNIWVRQIFVYRDRGTGELSAVVVPDLFELGNYAANTISSFEGLVSTTDPAALLRHEGVRNMVLQSLQATAREFGLQEYETVQRVRFQHAVFSQENQFLGVSLKQRRCELEKVFNT